MTVSLSASAQAHALSPVRGELQVVLLGTQHIPACVALARSSFEELGARADAVAAWFEARIVHNPWQHQLPGIGVGAFDGDTLVACRAMFAQPWWLEGRPTVLGFAAHTSVDIRYRDQRLGTRLIDASRSVTDITGSTSAGTITQRAYGRLGFVAIGGADNGFFRARAGYGGSLQARLGRNAGAAAARLLDLRLAWRYRRLGPTAGLQLAEVRVCGDEFDSLWHRVSAGQVSCLQRDAQYLNWRVFERPTAALQITALRDRQGHLLAWAVWTTVRYSDWVQVAVLRDLGIPADSEALAGPLLRLLIDHWRQRGCTWVSFEVTSPALDRLYRTHGFEHVPSRGNRYHVHGLPAADTPLAENWFRSGLDGDYFDLPPQFPPGDLT